jgi:hypothetical protein
LIWFWDNLIEGFEIWHARARSGMADSERAFTVQTDETKQTYLIHACWLRPLPHVFDLTGSMVLWIYLKRELG